MSNPTTAGDRRFRSCVGALFGIVFTGGVAHLALGPAADSPFLVAPMGASTVLLFAVPDSPLAQPWSIMGGNIVAAFVGVACAQLISTPVFAAGTAVAIAISLMLVLRCVHPPSGAVALTAVLGGPAIHALGYRFVLVPIALQSVALLSSALMFHFLMGHCYPHPSHATHAERVLRRWFGRIWARRRTMPSWEQGGAYARAGYEPAAPGNPAPVQGRAARALDEAHANGAALTCADIMAPLAGGMAAPAAGNFGCTISSAIPIAELAPHFKHHACERVGVLDERGHVVGTISHVDLIWGLYRQMHAPQLLAA